MGDLRCGVVGQSEIIEQDERPGDAGTGRGIAIELATGQ
jgi:hypothetical protein